MIEMKTSDGVRLGLLGLLCMPWLMGASCDLPIGAGEDAGMMPMTDAGPGAPDSGPGPVDAGPGPVDAGPMPDEGALVWPLIQIDVFDGARTQLTLRHGVWLREPSRTATHDVVPVRVELLAADGSVLHTFTPDAASIREDMHWFTAGGAPDYRNYARTDSMTIDAASAPLTAACARDDFAGRIFEGDVRVVNRVDGVEHSVLLSDPNPIDARSHEAMVLCHSNVDVDRFSLAEPESASLLLARSARGELGAVIATRIPRDPTPGEPLLDPFNGEGPQFRSDSPIATLDPIVRIALRPRAGVAAAPFTVAMAENHVINGCAPDCGLRQALNRQVRGPSVPFALPGGGHWCPEPAGTATSADGTAWADRVSSVDNYFDCDGRAADRAVGQGLVRASGSLTDGTAFVVEEYVRFGSWRHVGDLLDAGFE